MQPTHLIVRYGEIFLKGKNKGDFEKQLVKNIRTITGQSDVKLCAGRIFIPYWNNHKTLRRVFGLTSYSLALRVEKNMDAILAAAVEIAQKQNYLSLIAAHRSDKNFPLTSPEITKAVSQHLHSTFPNYDFKEDETLTIEIQASGAYLCSEKVICFGGLPTGCDGRVLVLVDGNEGMLAGLLTMKRGINIFPISFHDIDISLLEKYSASHLQINKFTNWQEVEEFAQRNRINVLMCGETFETFSPTTTNLVCLRPLIAYSVKQAREDYTKYQQAAI
ncbi:hypothetical protein HYV86_05675 [Candidatus Woesearchaeota archaeon]|nr:hypothetical protein [Candidatus Woesearchaeota archaeon]